MPITNMKKLSLFFFTVLVFVSGANLSASTIYDYRTSAGGVGPLNADIKLSNIVNFSTANGPSTTTTIYMEFRIKAPNVDPSDARIYWLDSSSNECARYDLTTGDKTLLADGNYHTFQVIADYYNPSQCSGSRSAGQVFFLGMGTGYWTDGNSADNSPWFYLSTDLPPPPDTSSHIESLTYSTTTATAIVTGYWNATSSSLYDTLTFYQTSNLFGQERSQTVNATSSGPFSLTFDFSPSYTYSSTTGTTTQNPPQITTLHAKLYSANDSDFCFGCSNTGTPAHLTLIDSTSTLPFSDVPYMYDLSDPRGVFDYPEYECSLSSITGCFKNAGVWLFYPSSQSTQQYFSLNSTIQGKWPFVYVYEMSSMFTDLFSGTAVSGSSTDVVVEINGEDVTMFSLSQTAEFPAFGPIRTLLSYFVWLALAWAVYRKVLGMHNQDHH